VNNITHQSQNLHPSSFYWQCTLGVTSLNWSHIHNFSLSYFTLHTEVKQTMNAYGLRSWEKLDQTKRGPYGIESPSSLVQTWSLVRSSTTSLLIHTKKQRQTCNFFSLIFWTLSTYKGDVKYSNTLLFKLFKICFRSISTSDKMDLQNFYIW